jgi:hypothetical protein
MPPRASGPGFRLRALTYNIWQLPQAAKAGAQRLAALLAHLAECGEEYDVLGLQVWDVVEGGGGEMCVSQR